MDEDGSSQVQLTTPPTDYFDGEPAWSPGTIAFSRGTGCIGIDGFPTVCHQLMLMDSDGSNQRVRQPDGHSLDATAPDWSPDGGKIAISYFGLTTIHPDGTGIKFIDSLDYVPSWSPGQNWIATVQFDSAFKTWLDTPDGSARVQVAQQTGRSVWSPDGTRIAFDQYSGTGATSSR